MRDSAPRTAKARHGSADLTAIAFRAATKLEAYQLQIEKLAANWRDSALYRAVSAQLDEISGLLGALPHLAVDLVEVVACHVKLLHLLPLQGVGDDLAQLQARQTDAVRSLRRKALRLIAVPAGGR